MNKWCVHENVRAECNECKLLDAELRIEQLETALALVTEMNHGLILVGSPPRHEDRQARKVALIHRLRRYRDQFVPEGTCHTCHAGCMHEGCLICASLNFLTDQ